MVAAVIVLYNPDFPLLDRLLRSITGQVDKVFVIDNTPGSCATFGSRLNEYQSNISYIPLGDNKGIAAAQNIGIRASLSEGYSHVLLLDQDSSPPLDMVNELLAGERTLLESGKKVAAVGPIFIDEKNGETSRAIRHGWFHVNKIQIDLDTAIPVEADYLISSGSLIRTSVLLELGTMLEELFIDWVDIEWGLRARHAGSKSYIIPSAVMRHSIGDTCVHVIGKNINLHNDIRNYYIVRNSTYLLRVKSMGWKWRSITILKLPQYVCFYSWHSRTRWDSFCLLCRALSDGIRGNVGCIG